jgi:Fe-S cluster assembly scaffold protein SufB
VRKVRDIDSNTKIDLRDYCDDADDHEYVESLSNIEETDAKQLLDIGVDVKEQDRLGTFIQKDKSIIHCQSREKGVEVMGISNALKKHPWLKEYVWKNISPETDQFTGRAKAKPHDGYFIHARAGIKAKHPVQSCLYIAKDGFSQNVHNIVIAEEDSELHIITGCATAPHLLTGLHIGVSEFYVKKRAKLTFTMIHDWGERVSVRPRTVMQVEAGGSVVSNYISLRPVGSLQMFPTTRLVGAGAVARFNSILVAGHGSHLDVGSRIVLDAPHTRAEIISRGISSGGAIIARGNLEGMSAGIKAHLECKGLILNNGMMKAIPELTAYVPGVEMSHEAAVGKIDQREIEYLMARGLDEDSAISTIVRGFLNVDIEGLPSGLKEKLDKIVVETQKDMM